MEPAQDNRLNLLLNIPQPNIQRVAIDLRLDYAHPLFATVLQLTDPPVRANISDVVLLVSSFSQLENRWQWLCDVIDYSVIRFSDVGPFRFDLNVADLRRIKIYRLHELRLGAQVDLLRFLSRHTLVRHLEIDTLELLENSMIELNFTCLKVLSIEAIRILTANGQEAPGGLAVILLEATWLQFVSFGVYLDLLVNQHFLFLSSLKRMPN